MKRRPFSSLSVIFISAFSCQLIDSTQSTGQLEFTSSTLPHKYYVELYVSLDSPEEIILPENARSGRPSAGINLNMRREGQMKRETERPSRRNPREQNKMSSQLSGKKVLSMNDISSGKVHSNRMIEVISSVQSREEQPSKMKSCRMYSEPAAVIDRLKIYPHITPRLISSTEMEKLLQRCEKYFMGKNRFQRDVNGDEGDENKVDGEENDQDSDQGQASLIYPGTKWCGAGNIADNYDDLGLERETDSCCREHDHCNDSISAGESKHGLHNGATYTKSACECDEKFYRCLQDVRSFVGDQVGRAYFNIIQNQCFREDYPIIGCDDVKGFVFNAISNACQSYALDKSKPKKYQFFDAKFYVGKHGPLLKIPVISDIVNPIVTGLKGSIINGGLFGNIIG